MRTNVMHHEPGQAGLPLRRVHLGIFPRAVLLLAAFVLDAVPVLAQALRPEFWVTDGTVSAVATSGNTVYLGGNFTTVGPATGAAALLDSVTGAPLAPFSGVVASVLAAVSDGAGRWYIGGSFTSVQGQVRTHLARILADGTLGRWNPGEGSGV